MKTLIIELKENIDKKGIFTLEISEEILPEFQKALVNGTDEKTFVDFIIKRA